MLSSLNSLAGKISPNSSGGSSYGINDEPVVLVSSLSNSENVESENESYCSTLTSDNPTHDNPDPDFIKMFVGQIPKSMEETELQAMFQEYGRVYAINVLRNKLTGGSKGCCFVTYYTRKAALKAQDALHNIKILDGMLHPIQMKPADSENRNERKLFIGMLNRKMTEDDVKNMFDRHDTIEECVVLRDQGGQSKGCAFVTFASKQAASLALKYFTMKKLVPGSPTVLKFADTQKDKEMKKIQQMQMGLWNSMLKTCSTTKKLESPIVQQQPTNHENKPLIAYPSVQYLQQYHTFGAPQTITTSVPHTPAPSAMRYSNQPYFLQNFSDYSAIHPSGQSGILPQPVQPLLANSSALLCLVGKTNAYGGNNHYSPSHHQPTPIPFSYHNPNTSGSSQMQHQHVLGNDQLDNRTQLIGRQNEGPPGCNLFIYHLPPEFTDLELTSIFMPFGNIVSSRVFIDKQSNLSKCFGFVSYDNPDSAQCAIRALHGFQIGTKRLKVQLKKPRDTSKPY